MSNETERIAELILKAIREELQQHEKEQLDEWMSKDPARGRLYEELTDNKYVAEQLERMESYDSNAIWSRIQEQKTAVLSQSSDLSQSSRLLQSSSSLSQRSRSLPFRSRRLLYWSVSVAAAILLALTGAYLLVHSNRRNPGLQAERKSLQPGGDRATLTLGDGTKILLDNASNGILARQGNANIVKQSGGELAYRDSGEAGEKVFYNTMETPIGGQYRLILPDGSKVWLNAASVIRYPNVFNGNSRVVRVTGEAYFEVARDPSRVFTVETGEIKVDVLGTTFNLMAYNDEESIRTTLIDGSVRVTHNKETQLIRPGQQAAFQHGQSQFRITSPDMDAVIGWKEGEFRFHQTDIQTIMRQVKRWYNVEVSEEGDLSHIRLSGIIARTQNASELIEILEATGKAHFEIEGNRIRVMPVKK